MEEKIRQIEKEYDDKKLPLFKDRSDVVKGVKEPLQKDFEQGQTDDGIKGGGKIVDFWLKTLKNNADISQQIHPNDEPILKCLMDIDVVKHYEEKEYESQTINFHFSDDVKAFFAETTLSKRFWLKEEDEEETVLEKSEGTKITWVDGKCVTKKTVKKKQKNKRSGETRHVTKDVEADSFFTFFRSITSPSEKEMEEMTEEDQDKLAGDMQQDLDMGEELANEIVPNAVSFYLGEIDDDDSEKDEEDDKGAEGKAKDGKSGGGGGGGTNKEECQNQ